MLAGLLDRFRSLAAYRELSGALPARAELRAISGLPGSSAAVLTAALAEDFPQRLLVVIAPGPSEAERWLADLSVLLGDRAALYPQREALGEEEPHLEIAGERMETVGKLLEGKIRVLVTTVRATVERTRIPRAVRELRLELRKGDRERLSRVVERLQAMGYERRPSVLDVTQYAVRGGIVDVYGFGMAAPTRIEWWGDEVVSIRHFDLDTQRSLQEIDAVSLLPRISPALAEQGDEGSAGDRQSILEILPLDALLVLDREVRYQEVERLWSEAEHHLAVARRRGEDVPGREVLFMEPQRWVELLDRFPRVAVSDAGGELHFPVSPPDAIGRDLSRVAALAGRLPVLILCDNEGQVERLEELLAPPGEPERLSPNITLAIGSLHGGFALPDLVVLTDHEIFNRPRRLRRARRYREAVSGGVGGLSPGDYVVHLEHGIGIYRGIETITAGGGTIEVAVLEYEGGDRLQVPLYRIDQLEPYRTGPEGDGSPPRLDRLGSTRWRRQRVRTERAVRKLAAELLELYARRSVAVGFACPPDTRWQHELESSFLYEDTPDQRKATEDVKRDMESPKPMDRLIVGDVGYGKTEVAIRAAFKAVQAGKQAAVLVPTTILAEQHGRTFRERLAAFPVNVAVLSRFRSSKEVRGILSGLKSGAIDIVIGTHRLLSRDVEFRDLGLLVIDEEHRFGVRHKERLKALRLSVDVLTLTATPIPRTLHMALSGLRDLTLIETPPRDRSPVLTFVEPWDDELLAEAIARELDRGGQVFVVHNRIETIDTVAARVQRLAPGASLAVAHGRMKESELDEVMRRFVEGDLDILVSTMIVESGLDVPNANTMIVHEADQFGLAQLYQLRGRVGRGHRRAYCYLLVGDTVDPEAERRLEVLEQHTDLGSGYRIALKDLEIRGAGNLLGAQQSGHAHSVGYDLYLRWLNEAVQALKEGKPAAWEPPDVSYDRPAHLPDWYVPDEDAKLDFYRRLARVVRRDEIAQLREELRDRFGPVPPEAEGLLIVSELRVLGAQAGLASVAIRGDEARLVFRAGAAPRLVRLNAALDRVQFAAEVRRVVPLSMKLTRLGGLDIGPGLVRALAEVVGEEEHTVRRKDATWGGS
ncbi:Transcription-repair-coupling factor [bacterium HR33]|nr:Transcription-repair-coupling factor [bacterium HR33]